GRHGISLVVLRFPARLPREPHDSGIQRATDCRLGRHRHVDHVCDRFVALVATWKRFPLWPPLGALAAFHFQSAPSAWILAVNPAGSCYGPLSRVPANVSPR